MTVLSFYAILLFLNMTTFNQVNTNERLRPHFVDEEVEAFEGSHKIGAVRARET